MNFYFGLGLQLVGLASVGLCLISGLAKGDYGSLDLVLFIGGPGIFYLGTILKKHRAS